MDMKRLFVSFVTAGIISLLIVSILGNFGITWDEPTYIRDADQYVTWLKNPQLGTVDTVFRVTVDDLHPPLRMALAGITHEVLVQRLRIINNTDGYRISSVLFVFPFIVVFAYVAIGHFGYLVGILLPFMYSLLPHVLFLTPLVTQDYAIASLWFVAVIFAMKGMTGFRWLTLSGICIGCTLLTKLHGFLLFIPVIGYWAFFYRKILVNTRSVLKKIPAIKKICYVIGIAFVVYFVAWPWLWTSPLSHLGDYFRVQFEHKSIPVYVFGQIFTRAPWWYAPVMFLSTTPALTLILFAVGAIYSFRKGKSWDRVMLINALYPLAFFSLPWVYSYDGIRIFLASFPFVCLVAGRGIIVLIRSLPSRLRFLGTGFVILAWIVTVYVSVIRIHPYESSYYNEFVGGISGAHKMGFETEFWGNAYLGVLPWMNAYKKDMMCVSPTTHPFYYYQAMGQIEPGVVFNAGRGACKYAVVLMRQGLLVYDPFTTNVVRTQKPVYTLTVDGVPLVGVYDIEGLEE
jgi:4-amino-4-deoxy-L-arabinose transferase-like glycosyltransferase